MSSRRILRLVLLLTPLMPALTGCGLVTRNEPLTVAGGNKALNARVLASSHAIFDYFEYRGNDPVFEEFKPGEGEYLNPILTGFYPDPSIVQVGADYYLVNSSFCYFPGLPIFHSRDLINWTQIGNIIDRSSQLDFANLGLSRGIFAPSISHHDGIFYLVTTCVDCGGNFVVTAKNPAGPWSDPVWLPEVDGIDPSLFFDDDGEAWIINNEEPVGGSTYDGHRALWVQRFNPGTITTFGPRTMIVNGGSNLAEKPIWIEGPHIFRRDGQLYLISAEGGTSIQHSQVVFKADKVRGPWKPHAGNPILTQRHLDPNRRYPITSVGHADFVETPSGQWWATFLATRPYQGNLYNTGRETFLMEVRWIDGWPVMTSGDELVPHVAPRPDLPAQPAPVIPMAGNFTVREEFDGPLPGYWMTMRTPKEVWYDLEKEPGAITIKARPESIGAFAQPSFLGRRQQHAYATVTTAMRYALKNHGDRAGLVALQNDQYYYFFGLQNVDDRILLVLGRRAGPGDVVDGHVIESMSFPDARIKPIELRIEARAAEYDFWYRLPNGDWRLFAEKLDGTLLSTEVAQGFVGATFGMYAYSPGASPN